jgi:hypothetical protein
MPALRDSAGQDPQDVAMLPRSEIGRALAFLGEDAIGAYLDRVGQVIVIWRDEHDGTAFAYQPCHSISPLPSRSTTTRLPFLKSLIPLGSIICELPGSTAPIDR